ncbi:MAG: peptide chain release factor 1 [Proteobacteria bacterium]|nr:peptide chain release factor 1 [Pseudomonadota bacterium]MBQ9243643.1 peptide chain release factor 1 [Pseudomonadota bacterium]
MSPKLLQNLQELERRYEDTAHRLGDPDTLENPAKYNALAKERADMEPIVNAFRALKAAEQELSDAREMLAEDDEDIRAMAKEDIARLEPEINAKREELQIMMLPKDPMDSRNIILEVRAGTGGDEASLFAGDIFEMYTRYAAKMNWRVEIISASEGTVGGYKEVVAMVSGTDVYAHLKFEAGTHRVQRVPVTESQGRIQTSACTVAILPEAEDVDMKIDEKDLRIDTYRSSGAGGQHVNKTESAIRITHIPTGLVVTSQDERSQHKNKAKAMKVLASRLYDLQRSKLDSERAGARKSMVGSGDRSERIRTYNYPQNRITDHRIGLTVYNLDTVVETGELDEIIKALKTAEHLEQLNSEET